MNYVILELEGFRKVQLLNDTEQLPFNFYECGLNTFLHSDFGNDILMSIVLKFHRVGVDHSTGYPL